MSCIIERTECAIINVDRVAANQCDFSQNGAALCNKRAARLTPELCVFCDWHGCESFVDRIREEVHWRWLFARIGNREATTDIDNVDSNVRFKNEAGQVLAMN